MPEPNTTVARVVYASESNLREHVYAELERIRASALRHNPHVGIHTALLYQSGWFVQWKEGPADAIRMAMERVGRDPRHSNLQVVHESTGPRLLAGPWSMAVVLADDTREDMTRRVAQVRARRGAGKPDAPPAVWRQLSTPMMHPGAGRQHDPDRFQRILACASIGQPSFDLVQWLARAHAQPVVHRRFAGESGLDVGTDYVDFVDDDRVTRAIAMARGGLDLPLTRAFLPDYSHVVLLFSGDATRDLPLLHRVAEACATLPSPPAILGVTHDEGLHADAFAYAHAWGLVYLDGHANPYEPADVWHAARPYLERWRAAASSGGLLAT